MKRMIWIAYDLGIRGDYEGMYAWLDERDAKECGDSLALVNYDVKKDLLKELKADLGGTLDLNKRARIYVIHLDPSTRKMKGTFLFGRRRASRWTGFASGAGEVDEGEL